MSADIVERLRDHPEENAMTTDIDTTTLATDKDCLKVEMLARSRGALHWPELVRVINRMRTAEAALAKAREALEPFHKLDRQIVQGHLDGHVADDDKIYARVGDIRKASDTFAALAPEGK